MLYYLPHQMNVTEVLSTTHSVITTRGAIVSNSTSSYYPVADDVYGPILKIALTMVISIIVIGILGCVAYIQVRRRRRLVSALPVNKGMGLFMARKSDLKRESISEIKLQTIVVDNDSDDSTSNESDEGDSYDRTMGIHDLGLRTLVILSDSDSESV